MTYRQRRRHQLVIYVFAFMLAMPPGFMTPVFGASRTATQSRTTELETFRNPSISGAGWNRFLGVKGARDLTGGGGTSLASPAAKGFGAAESPANLWLANEGRLEWAEQDMSFPGVGMHVVFQRIWRGSVTAYDGPLGEGWEFGWNKRLYEDQGDNDVLFFDMGRQEEYDESSGSYTSPVGRYDTLEKDTTPDPDIFTRTDKWGVVETYEDEGSGWFRLVEIEDLNGNEITFAYDNSDQLTKVTDTLDRDTTISYDGNGRIDEITDPASRVWEYDYHTNGNLTSVKDPLDNATIYAYDGSDRLLSVQLPEDSTPSFAVTYSGDAVATQTVNGSAWTITYDTTNRWVTIPDREIADAETRYQYDTDGRIISREIYEDTAGSPWTTSYSYNSDHEVTEVVFDRGNEVEYTYDSSGNILTVELLKDSSDSSPVTWAYTYTSQNRLSTLTDPNGEVWDYDHDADGNVTKLTAPSVTVPSGIAVTDKNGNGTNDGTIVQEWAYDNAGLLTKATDARGTETTYSYTTVNSKSAYVSTVDRDSAMSGLFLTTTYAYDAAGNVTSVTDPESNVTTHTVNSNNLVTQTVEPLAVTRTYGYDDNNRVTETTVTNDTTVGNGSYVVTQQYGSANKITKTLRDVDGTATRLETEFFYDDAERLTKQTDPRDTDTVYTYDVRGARMTSERAPGTLDIENVSAFDGNGNRITSTDPLGNHTVNEYDLYDRLTKTKDPVGHYTTYAHDDAGNVTKTSRYNVGNTLLAETTSFYDEANRVYKTERMAKKADLSTNLGDGLQTKSIWRDEAGAVIESTGDVCGCSATEYIYDAVGRRVTTKDALSTNQNLVISEYDDNGNVTKVTREDASQDTGIEADKDIITETVYDARNRATTRKLRLDGNTTFDTVYEYGKRDQLTKVTSPEGDVAKTEYNEALWRTKSTQETAGDDVITEFEYDAGGNMITYRAKNSTTGDQNTVYTIDRVGRVITTKWPDGGERIQTYDKASNRVSTTDPIGTVVVCTYDDNNRLTNKSMTLATNVIGVDDIDYGYDGLGRMTSADATEGVSFTSVVEWTYNTLGKVETEKQIIDGFNSGAGRTITYDWNVKGQKTETTYPVSGDEVTYSRDELDRVDAITRDGSEVVDYTYSGQRLIGKDFPGSYAEHTYDGAGRLEQILHKDDSTGNTLLQLDYGFDDDSQITHIDRLFYDDVSNTRILLDTSDEGEQYAYDGAGRLVTVLKGVPTAYISTAMGTNITNGDYDDLVEYHYDQTGNRVTLEIDGVDDTTYEHNTVNEMTDENATTHTYDDNGNFEGVSNAYKYDFENRLAEHDDGTHTWTWHYDALGRLIQRDRTSLTRHLRNYYDGQQIVDKAEYNSGTSAETHKKTWVYGPRIDELLLYEPANGDDYYAHADHLGSVMLLVHDTGAIEESYRYDAWGAPTIVDDTFTKLSQGANSPVANSVMYTGRRRAKDAAGSGEDWYYYRARHYRADAGRFVQRDPAEFIDGANSYRYVIGDPVSNRDPLGLTVWLDPYLICLSNCDEVNPKCSNNAAAAAKLHQQNCVSEKKSIANAIGGLIFLLDFFFSIRDSCQKEAQNVWASTYEKCCVTSCKRLLGVAGVGGPITGG